MQLPQDEKQQALKRLIDNARDWYDDNLATFILRLHQYYPDDIGLFAPLFLNCLTLQPGRGDVSFTRYVTCVCSWRRRGSDGQLR
jgi:mannose-6-phosphate isomerase class I